MSPQMLIFILLAPVLVSKLLVPYVRWVALRNNWVDNPDGKRKHHENPTPNIGGLAIAGSFGLCLVGALQFQGVISLEFSASTLLILVSALLIIVTGFYDDIRGVGYKRKFFVQILVAYLILHAGYRVDVSNIFYMIDDPYQLSLFSTPITLLWILGILNAINLIDGLDGLAAGISGIAFTFLAIIWGIEGDVMQMAIALLMVGALIGFLMYNYTPASIFMGDSGSLFLGFMLTLSTMSLEGQVHENGIIAFFIPVIILGLPILDTSVCFIRRYLAGLSPFAPDHNHIHHRLAKLTSRKHAVLIMYGVSAWYGTSALLATILSTSIGFVIIAVTILLSIAGIRLLDFLEEAYHASEEEETLGYNTSISMQALGAVTNGGSDESKREGRYYSVAQNAEADHEDHPVIEVRP